MAEEAAGSSSPEAEGEAAADIELGSYEIIRRRLVDQAAELGQLTEELNRKRIEQFGGSELAVVGSVRIRTENNCVPRDIAQVGDRLLFGYNVFIGLKKETDVGDVFSCHRFVEQDGSFSFEDLEADFLAEDKFRQDFGELYSYYRSTKLLQLRNLEGQLLAVFQTGATAQDFKVLRWALDVDGDAVYVDNRGERDHTFAHSHDFEWTPTGRDQHVQGKHPHVDILGKVFVETVGGDLTIKIEDNTEDGEGIYREPVDDADQALDDAEIHFAELGTIILLKILPYKEETWRYLVYNTRTHTVDRIDAIGLACQQLPEDHGIIFPGGFYLQSGETKSFDEDISDLEYVKRLRSPNGEDVLYVFHHREQGSSLLLPYNMIRKEVATPISCHGYCVFESGRMIVFRRLSDEPTRVHTMQIWQTPFMTDEFAARDQGARAETFLEKVGNADLVRAISDTLSLQRTVERQRPSVPVYEDLIAAAGRVLDAYYWIDSEELLGDGRNLGKVVAQVRETAELVVDEFEKTEQIRAQAKTAVAEAEEQIDELLRSLTTDSFDSAEHYVSALGQLRAQRGHLITLRDLRYVDRARLDELEAQLVEHFDQLSDKTVAYMKSEGALAPYHQHLADLEQRIGQIEKVADARPVAEEVEEIDQGLQLLAEVTTGLEIDDATVRAELLESISEVLAGVNRVRALLETRRHGLRSHEAVAEFGAEFKLFSQSVTGALNLAKTPDDCDAALAKQMVELEELESRYADFDEFLAELTTKREEVYEAFTSKKQTLLDQRQRRVQQMADAASRIVESVERRALSFGDADELNAFYAADPMVAKLRDLSASLRELGDSVKADELDSMLKASRQDAARALRDRLDIFEEGTEVIRLGRHRFSVNTQPLDLTLVPRGDDMAVHMTGTDFYEQVVDEEFEQTRELWSQTLVSETNEVYRAEYLAGCMLADAELHEHGLGLDDLHAAVAAGELLERVRAYAGERYDEGYERGVHDADAAAILDKLLSLHSTAGVLRFPGNARALACLFWAFGLEREAREQIQKRSRSMIHLRQAFGPGQAHEELAEDLAEHMRAFVEAEGLDRSGHWERSNLRLAAVYLMEELAEVQPSFVASGDALTLRDGFLQHLSGAGLDGSFRDDLRTLADLGHRYHLVRAWLDGYLQSAQAPVADSSDDEAQRAATALRPALREAAALLLTDSKLTHRESHAPVHAVVEGLLGQHARVRDQRLEVRLDELVTRIDGFRRYRVPGFRDYQQKRHELLERERHRLRISEFVPKVMSSFVRNQLLDQVYLPLIGDNLAKQIGALGDSKRTDLMGLLLLISPPGYGKTTLMEYVANRLGLVFMKINGPALGHDVTSLDPGQAPSVTARQEVEKINLAFEMGNNVLLYIDDIQHTSGEFLQKFISLCDAQRRVEGVWQGRTRTYDLRGKRFCVCMAGNPYTEAGERFQIPDMLANRADTYNLGDILEGRDDLFALSYIENSLTSSSVLSSLAGRDPADVELLVRMAKGEQVQADQLSHPYSSVELGEILAVLKKLLRAQEVLLAVNQAYIYSSSQDDAFRTEPRFQLQGSYRNMNKLAEKIVPVMNDDELEALLDDHYAGESQTLTTGAEHNMLKLRELRGVLTEEEQRRWNEIKQGYLRVRALGGAEDDPVTRVTSTLGLVSDRLSDIGRQIESAVVRQAELEALGNQRLEIDFEPYLEKLQGTIDALAERPSLEDADTQAIRIPEIVSSGRSAGRAPGGAARPADRGDEPRSRRRRGCDRQRHRRGGRAHARQCRRLGAGGADAASRCVLAVQGPVEHSGRADDGAAARHLPLAQAQRPDRPAHRRPDESLAAEPRPLQPADRDAAEDRYPGTGVRSSAGEVSEVGEERRRLAALATECPGRPLWGAAIQPACQNPPSRRSS